LRKDREEGIRGSFAATNATGATDARVAISCTIRMATLDCTIYQFAINARVSRYAVICEKLYERRCDGATYIKYRYQPFVR